VRTLSASANPDLPDPAVRTLSGSATLGHSAGSWPRVRRSYRSGRRPVVRRQACPVRRGGPAGEVHLLLPAGAWAGTQNGLRCRPSRRRWPGRRPAGCSHGSHERRPHSGDRRAPKERRQTDGCPLAACRFRPRHASHPSQRHHANHPRQHHHASHPSQHHHAKYPSQHHHAKYPSQHHHAKYPSQHHHANHPSQHHYANHPSQRVNQRPHHRAGRPYQRHHAGLPNHRHHVGHPSWRPHVGRANHSRRVRRLNRYQCQRASGWSRCQRASCRCQRPHRHANGQLNRPGRRRCHAGGQHSHHHASRPCRSHPCRHRGQERFLGDPIRCSRKTWPARPAPPWRRQSRIRASGPRGGPSIRRPVARSRPPPTPTLRAVVSAATPPECQTTP
jgi:hypothetical protein